jgi:co-chaperonin GroES (HSP10)
MKATKNFYHINIDDNENWEISTESGFKLFFDPEFDTVNNIIQYGKVINPPIAINKQTNMTQPEAGDTIYFHHQVYGNKVEFEEDYFRWATHDQLFFIIKNDGIVMLNDFVLLEPIETQEESGGILLESTPKRIKQRGNVVALPEYADGLGLEFNDEVVFTKNSDYVITVGEKDYYLMNVNDIIGLVVNGDKGEVVIPVGQWSLVEPLDEGSDYENHNGVLVQRKVKKHEKHRGLVYKTFDTVLGIKDGDKVIYDRKPFFSFVENKKKYYAVNADRDIFALVLE